MRHFTATNSVCESTKSCDSDENRRDPVRVNALCVSFCSQTGWGSSHPNRRFLELCFSDGDPSLFSSLRGCVLHYRCLRLKPSPIRYVSDWFPEPCSRLSPPFNASKKPTTSVTDVNVLPRPPSQWRCSHVVKTLKFGTQVPVRGRRAIEPGVELEGLPALEDRVYSIDNLHTAPHHYIKVSQSGGGLFRAALSRCCYAHVLVGLVFVVLLTRAKGALPRQRSGRASRGQPSSVRLWSDGIRWAPPCACLLPFVLRTPNQVCIPLVYKTKFETASPTKV